VYLSRHSAAGGPRWALDGSYLPEGFTLTRLLEGPVAEARAAIEGLAAGGAAEDPLLPPVDPDQEVWASGVTYERSREAREHESADADAYARVYEADRPELFFKAPGWRVVGPGGTVRVRRDSGWNVPEPELVLVLNGRMEVLGYTAGNDVSSRDIEGENPLYLPQAKVYDGSCSLGPGIVLAGPDAMRDLPIRPRLSGRRGDLCGRGLHVKDEALLRGARGVPGQGADPALRRLPDDGHGPRAARRVHPDAGGPGRGLRQRARAGERRGGVAGHEIRRARIG
jgi:2-dehydro-3-deoxy-D-arabinonate dehydratase